MVLAQVARQARGEAVRTDVVDDSNPKRLEVRLFIGRQSALISSAGIDVAKALGDPAVRRAVEQRIQETADSLQRHPPEAAG
jgi:hypothetical protein